MSRICLASHHPEQTTSFARVARVVAGAMVAAGHSVRLVGSVIDDRLGLDAGGYVTRRVRPAELADAARRAAADADLLITVGDPWMFEGLESVRRDSPGCRWLSCFPLDGGPVPREWTAWIAAAHRRVVFSDHARQLLAETGTDADVVPHGVDLNVFNSQDKPAAKRAVVGDGGAFIVGFVGTNSLRKNIPALLRAFTTFAADKPDALLYLHTPIVGYWDLEELTDRYGITARTRATLNFHPQFGLPDATLAKLYNAMDLLVLPTMGEGFGLPLLEAAACGVPTIATDCAACPELLPDPIQRAAVRAWITMRRGIEQAIVDEDDLSRRMDALYRDAARHGAMELVDKTL